MPKLNVDMPHALGQEEALRRLKIKLDETIATKGSHVSKLQHQWIDHSLAYSFHIMGMGVSGTVKIEDALVRIHADIPFAAMLMKGMIEKELRQEFGSVLA